MESWALGSWQRGTLFKERRMEWGQTKEQLSQTQLPSRYKKLDTLAETSEGKRGPSMRLRTERVCNQGSCQKLTLLPEKMVCLTPIKIFWPLKKHLPMFEFVKDERFLLVEQTLTHDKWLSRLYLQTNFPKKAKLRSKVLKIPNPRSLVLFVTSSQPTKYNLLVSFEEDHKNLRNNLSKSWQVPFGKERLCM